ncbi:hypothetical protein [Tenggerimyces flavus]|uniref:Uncharacterized protein n=1 Tax=Tenggerimyces flavus TaxID=1708749 RepID=A0ABV7YB66_9ACTN|nr:hypothetical protein [Tenggerimyces flavus]MBM7786670.1 heme exporter protein D [Tenggerimyces flavus]
MKWYADRPARLARQVIADLFAVGWVGLWVWVALGARDFVLSLRAPGDRMVSAGAGIRDAFTDAASKAREVPVVGDDLASALGRGTSAGDSLAGAGSAQISVVQDTALWLAVALVAVPVLFLLITWLPLRLRFALRAGAAVKLRDKPELLALRALATLPTRTLTQFDGDPAAAWRTGDVDVIEDLARRHLASLGVRRDGGHSPGSGGASGSSA